MFLVQSGIIPALQHSILLSQPAYLHPIKCSLTQKGRRLFIFDPQESGRKEITHTHRLDKLYYLCMSMSVR